MAEPKATPCSACGHALTAHDTGWDAAGCMAPNCTCTAYRKPPRAAHPEPEPAPVETHGHCGCPEDEAESTGHAHCSRCGVVRDEDSHECPPGFLAEPAQPEPPPESADCPCGSDRYNRRFPSSPAPHALNCPKHAPAQPEEPDPLRRLAEEWLMGECQRIDSAQVARLRALLERVVRECAEATCACGFLPEDCANKKNVLRRWGLSESEEEK